jgi:hypothetical protein
VWNEVWDSILVNVQSSSKEKSSTFTNHRPTVFANAPDPRRNINLPVRKGQEVEKSRVKRGRKLSKSQNLESDCKKSELSSISQPTEKIEPEYFSEHGKEFEPLNEILIENSAPLANNSQLSHYAASEKHPNNFIQHSLAKENPFSQRDIQAPAKIQFSFSHSSKSLQALSLNESLPEEALEQVNSLGQQPKKLLQDSMKSGSFLFQGRKRQKNLNSSEFLSAKAESQNVGSRGSILQFASNSQGRAEEEEKFYDCLDEEIDLQLQEKFK